MRNKKLIIIFSVLLSVTLLAVFSGVLFSVQHVRAYCENVPEKSEYEDEVLSSHGIKKGTSIFFVNENKVKAAVEKKLNNRVRVLNIERVFPNRIYINYVEVKPYLRIRKATSDGITTYYCSNDMRVMYEYDGVHSETPAIDLKFKGDFGVGENGELKFSDPSASAIVKEIFAAFELLNYYDNVIPIFGGENGNIDLTGNYIVLNTREGVQWQIHGADNLKAKIRLALSYYVSQNEKESGSTIIVSNENTVTYVPSGGVKPVD